MFHILDGRRVHSVSFGAGPGTLVGIAGSFADWEIWAPTFELLSPRWSRRVRPRRRRRDEGPPRNDHSRAPSGDAVFGTRH